MISPIFRKTCHLITKERCIPQHVVTVETSVRYRSHQRKTDLCIAENASKTIDLLQEKAATGVVPDLVDETTVHVKCTMQNVVTVEPIVRYHSHQRKTDLCIAENASKNTNKIRKQF